MTRMKKLIFLLAILVVLVSTFPFDDEKGVFNDDESDFEEVTEYDYKTNIFEITEDAENDLFEMEEVTEMTTEAPTEIEYDILSIAETHNDDEPSFTSKDVKIMVKNSIILSVLGIVFYLYLFM